MTRKIQKTTILECTPGRVLREPILADLLGYSISTLRNKRRPGSPSYDSTFPLPIRLGENSIAYLEIEVLEWIATRERVSAGGSK